MSTVDPSPIGETDNDPFSLGDSEDEKESKDRVGGKEIKMDDAERLKKAAAEAMRLASKVSVRGDEQGVLSLQFMVEVEGGGVSFVDFRFVPYLRDEDEDDGEASHDEEYEYEDEEPL